MRKVKIVRIVRSVEVVFNERGDLTSLTILTSGTLYLSFFLSRELFFFLSPFFFVELRENVNHLPAVIPPAIPAHRVGTRGLCAMGAHAKTPGRKGMVGADAIPLALRMSHSNNHGDDDTK